MTDFLTDLLGRGRGETIELAPRLPSIFEPMTPEAFQSEWDGPVAPPPAGDETQPTVLPSLPPRRVPAEGTPPPTGSTAEWNPPSTAPRTYDDVVALRRPVADADAGAARSAMVEVPDRRPVTPNVVARTESVADMLGPSRKEPPAVSEATRTRPDDDARPVRPDPGEHQHPSTPRPASADHRSGQAPAPGVRHRHDPAPPADDSSRRPGTVPTTLWPQAPRVPPRRAEPRPVSVGDTGDPPEPTVHVTIGRLEIRAVPAAAPPARRARSVPPMSLDEYLTERNGRRQA